MTRGHFSQLWKHISKWPKGSANLQHAVYRYVGATDETKAETYQICDEPVWRRAILENCNDSDIQTLDLGMKDTDEGCRQLAYGKFNLHLFTTRLMTNALLNFDATVSDRALAMQGAPAFVNQRVESVLKGDDKAALSGLASNKSLSLGYLQKVRGRLGELGDDFGVWMAGKTIEDVEKTRAPDNARELFEEKGKFLEAKIDFLGERILYYEAQFGRVRKGLTRAVIALAVIWFGWRLLVWILNHA